MEDKLCVKDKGDRLIFIEFLRIIACFLVIVNHTNSRIFLGTTPSVLWGTSLAYFYISKIAVPLFIMITGYTMLDRQDSYKKIFYKLFKMIGILVGFSLVYYTYDCVYENIGQFNLIQFFSFIVHGPITNAYWYLYLYIGIIFMMPFLQKLVSSLEKKDYHFYFLVSGVFCGVWPIVVHYFPFLNYTDYFMIPVYNSYIFMLLLGAYLKKYYIYSLKWRNICIIAFITICMLNVGLTYNEYIKNDGVKYLFFDDRTLLPIIAASFCVFYIVRTLNFSAKISKIAVVFGNLTFGIYLCSDFIIHRLDNLYYTLVSNGLYPMIAMVIFQIIIFIIGTIVTFIIKKIPILKKLI